MSHTALRRALTLYTSRRYVTHSVTESVDVIHKLYVAHSVLTQTSALTVQLCLFCQTFISFIRVDIEQLLAY